MAASFGYGKIKGHAPKATIKSFNAELQPPLWDKINNTNNKYPNLGSPVIFPAITRNTTSVFIPGDLQVNGTIYGNNQSILPDLRIKENINTISLSLADELLLLEPKHFTYENDSTLHYGFIEQDLEIHLPKLVSEIKLPNYKHLIKSVNYLELIPLLVVKIQDLQRQIDELKRK